MLPFELASFDEKAANGNLRLLFIFQPGNSSPYLAEVLAIKQHHPAATFKAGRMATPRLWI